MTQMTPTGAGPYPSPEAAWYTTGLLLVAYSLSYADRMVMSLLVGPIKHDLQISDVQVSLLIGAAFALFYVLMGLPFGYLADRVNRRNLIVVGIVSWSLATGLCGLAGSFALLFLARMAVGAGEAALAPSAYSLLSDLFPREKLGRAVSVYVIGNPLGTGAALTMGGVFIAAVTQTPMMDVPGLGSISTWRLVFMGLVVPGLILALLILVTVSEPPRRDDAKASGQVQDWREGFRFLRDNRATFICLLGGISLLSAAVSGAMTWIPTFFIRTHGLNAAAIGLYYGLILGGAGVGGLLFGGWLGDWLAQRGAPDGHPRVLAWAAALSIAPSVAAPLMPTPALSFIMLILSVAATGMTNAVSAASVQLATPGRLRGQISSVFILTASVAGIGLGPTIVAAITDYGFRDEMAVRYSLAILAATALPAATLLLFMGLRHYRRTLAIVHPAPVALPIVEL